MDIVWTEFFRNCHQWCTVENRLEGIFDFQIKVKKIALQDFQPLVTVSIKRGVFLNFRNNLLFPEKIQHGFFHKFDSDHSLNLFGEPNQIQRFSTKRNQTTLRFDFIKMMPVLEQKRVGPQDMKANPVFVPPWWPAIKIVFLVHILVQSYYAIRGRGAVFSKWRW